MDFITRLDTELFLFLNGLHVDWLDPVMTFISGKITWAPFYLVLLFLVIKNYKRQSILIVIGIILLIICSDQISSGIFKPIFERPRPCHNEAIKDLVYLPNGRCGGAYGFISSHACNTFALAVFITHILKKHYKKIAWVMFIWASLVAYSRIYMGVHYPGDIIVGAIVGMIVGILISKLYDMISQRVESQRRRVSKSHSHSQGHSQGQQ